MSEYAVIEEESMLGFAFCNPGAAPLAFMEDQAVISARLWSRVFHATSYKIAGS